MQSSNKRIARNTLMLYIRTFVMMPVSLYTSRIILEVLGENDFGVYNVVGGFIALLSFINSAMTKATQRFLNVELGKGNHDRVSRVYSMSLLIHFAIAVFIGFVLETVGLYFFETKLNIPPETQDAARIVYHISVVTACLHFIRIPDESSIIAYERMSFFAYVSIIEVMAKLGTVFLLFWAEDNRLVLYAVALMTVGILLNIIYAIYCKRNFTTCRFRFYFDIKLLKEMLFFSSWSLFGGIAHVASIQGISILLNIFFTVAVNAAMGVASQVFSAVNTLVTNFQKAVQPQIVQSYFSGDKSRFLELVFRSSKFSYFLLFFVAYPLILICRPVVELWLVCVPQYTVQFIQLYLIFLLIDALSGSLWVSSETIGNIAKYQFTVSLMIIMNIPIIYVLFKFGCSPVYAVIVRIAINFITHCYRIFYLKHKVNFPVRRYVVEVMFRCLWVSVCIIPVPFFLHKFLTSSWGSHILVVLTSLIISGLVIYKFGLDAKERGFVISTVTNKFMFLKKQ